MRTIPSASELRLRARTLLTGNWVPVCLISCLQIICTFLLSRLVSLVFSGNIFSFVFALAFFAYGLISFLLIGGYAYVFLNVSRERRIRTGDLFYSFQHQPDRIFVWFLIHASYALSCFLFPTYLLLQDMAGRPAWIYWPHVLIGILLFLAIFLFFALRFAMVPFLYAESPWKNAAALLVESQEMMKGQKLRLFTLECSFLGYYLLAILSLGIGFVWVKPYVYTTRAQFYLDLRSRQTT